MLKKKFKNIKTSVFIFSFLIFILFSSIVLNINIHGDSKFHSLYAKISAETGHIVKNQPFVIYEFDGTKKINSPIAYPLTSTSLFTILYLFGEDTNLKLYSPICAAIIFLLLYLCIKEIGIYKAIFISSISTLSIGERLIMTPLMEPFMIVLLLAGLLCLKRYFYTHENSYLIISSIFFGAGASIKQQSLVILIYACLILFWHLIFKQLLNNKLSIRYISQFLIFLLISIGIPIGTIKDQINRTGTFAYAPGQIDLPAKTPFYKSLQPLFVSKYKINSESLKAKNLIIGYNKTPLTLKDRFNGFMMSPFLFYRSTNQNYYDQAIFNLVLLILFLIFFTLIIMKNKNNNFDKNFWIITVGLILTELFTSYLVKTPITQYHSFGVVLSTLLIFYAPLGFHNYSKKITYLIIVTFLIFFITGYSQFIFPLWTNSGREDNYQIEAYKRIGHFVKNNTPNDSVFLAAETSFRYYAYRDTIWLNESTGDSIYKINFSSDEILTVSELKKLNIDYIVINSDQTRRKGVNDYLYIDGLVSIINNSIYFTKVYDPYGDNQFVVYRVNYY